MKLTIPYFKNSGEVGEPIIIEVDEKLLKFSPALISQAIHVENNRIFKKSGLTKRKGEVSGGGKKPWKQKGTGRARAGSIRSPLFRGGGITFGPTAENEVLIIPKKMKAKAFSCLIADKVKGKDVAVIEDIKLKNKKTKLAGQILTRIAGVKRSILAVDEAEMPDVICFRNLALVEIKRPGDLTLNDLNTKKEIIFSAKAFEQIKGKFTK